MIQLGYFTLDTPDIERARAFYAGLFDWTFDEAASHPAYAHVKDSDPAEISRFTLSNSLFDQV